MSTATGNITAATTLTAGMGTDMAGATRAIIAAKVCAAGTAGHRKMPVSFASHLRLPHALCWAYTFRPTAARRGKMARYLMHVNSGGVAMKKILVSALYLLCMASVPASAQSLLNSHESIDIKASIWKVWDAVKDFDGLANWHPMFSDDEIKSGENNEVGAIRTMTVKDGPSFDEELLSYDALDKKFSYRVIDPVPLPIANYVSTFQVIEGRRGYTTILWNSAYRNNSEGKMKDEEVIGFINNAYRVGLDNLKTMLETQ